MIFLYTLVRSFLVGFAFLLNDEAYQLQDLRALRILHSPYVHLPHSIYHIISPGFAFYPKQKQITCLLIKQFVFLEIQRMYSCERCLFSIYYVPVLLTG